MDGDRRGSGERARLNETRVGRQTSQGLLRPAAAAAARGIGALIGARAATPLAILAHSRFETEAADGAAVAATTVALGAAAAGAFIGLATCG